MTEGGLAIDAATIDRFRRDLDPLLARGERVGIAVSGGPDSMALLLLAAAARPGDVEAATVDHVLRERSRKEAEMVSGPAMSNGTPSAPYRWSPAACSSEERSGKYRYSVRSEIPAARATSAMDTSSTPLVIEMM